MTATHIAPFHKGRQVFIEKWVDSAQPFVLNRVEEHSMEKSLYPYLQMKIHERLESDTCLQGEISIIGNYKRTDGISVKEKKQKKFNWQRPTLQTGPQNNWNYLVYPGRDYVTHYAAMLATWHSFKNIKTNSSYKLPTERECWAPLLNSNIFETPVSDSVVIGSGLEALSDGIWHGKGPFFWSSLASKQKQTTLLGCEHSLWGDIGGRVVRLLSSLGFKKIVYIGKLGALKKRMIPNMYLATGNESYLNGEIIRWDNIFEKAKSPLLIKGRHFNLASVMFETKSWVEDHMTRFDFVDPEIGHMAKAAVESNVQFGYLHIISDNLVEKFPHDLSNERQTEVLLMRKHLLKNQITEGLETCL